MLAEMDIATTVADAPLEMQGMINGLNTWSDVVALVDTVSGEKVVRTPTDIAARKAAIAQKRTDLSAQIKVLGDAAGQDADELRPVINTLGGVEKALNFAETHLSLQDPGVDAAIAVLAKLQTLYKSYQDEFAVVNEAAQTLTDLKIAVKRALLARLKVEEDALLTEVALHERSETEFKAVDHLLKRCAVPEGVPKEEAIDETLDRLATDRPRLEIAVNALYACGSLAAEGTLPKRLLNLRLAQLNHLRSIQLSAANARVYEAVLGGGVQRLALFYQGGVKPQAIAQIIQSLSAAGIFGKFLTE
jgi:hypothetical protein